MYSHINVCIVHSSRRHTNLNQTLTEHCNSRGKVIRTFVLRDSLFFRGVYSRLFPTRSCLSVFSSNAIHLCDVKVFTSLEVPGIKVAKNVGFLRLSTHIN